MSFKEDMHWRYTTKKYNADKKIDKESIEALKDILRMSPSSINSQPWKFTFIKDQDLKNQLSKVSWINTPKVVDSDTLVVFSRMNNLDLFEKQIEEVLPAGAVGYYKEFIKPLPKHEIFAWFDKQVYIALGVLMSACAVMKIDATPMEGIEPDNYDKILQQKDHHTIAAVAIGYRHDEDKNQPQLNPKSRKPIDWVIETK